MAYQREAYAVLGLLPRASREDIEAMYRIRAKQLPLDHGGSDEAMAELNAARERALEQVMEEK